LRAPSVIVPKVVAGYRSQARARIVAAARDVFRRKGVGHSTMEDIARELGVSKGALYIYFRKKSELLTAIQEQTRAQVLASWERLLDEGDVAEGIASSLDAVFSGEVHPAIWHELLTEAASDPEVRKALELDMKEDTRMMRSFLQKLAARGRIAPMGDPEAVTDIILMLLQGTATRILTKGPSADARRRIVRALRLVLGIPSPASGSSHRERAS
jgi:TetR/AcrR family transcriptional regulator, repressor for uid operon